MKRVLITGGTGFLGSYLVRELIQNNYKPILLVHNPANPPPPGVEFLYGDVGLYQFGLDRVPKVDLIINCAGIIKFSPKDSSILKRVNISGALHAADLALSLGVPLYHVSTAYVCGDYKSRFLPEYLDMGQKFRNEYEKSKFEAEKLLRMIEGLQLCIFRPSILVGDSQVKGLPPVAGYYAFIKALDGIKRWMEQKLSLPHMEVIIRIRTKKNNTLNLIPVDVVVKQMVEIINSGNMGTYHLTNSSPPTMEELSKAVSEAIGAWVIPEEEFTPNVAEALVERVMKDLFPYLQGEPLFDTQSTTSICQTYCPKLTHQFLVDTTRSFLFQKRMEGYPKSVEEVE